jgi:hypothetical protein
VAKKVCGGYTAAIAALLLRGSLLERNFDSSFLYQWLSVPLWRISITSLLDFQSPVNLLGVNILCIRSDDIEGKKKKVMVDGEAGTTSR